MPSASDPSIIPRKRTLRSQTRIDYTERLVVDEESSSEELGVSKPERATNKVARAPSSGDTAKLARAAKAVSSNAAPNNKRKSHVVEDSEESNDSSSEEKDNINNSLT